MADSLKQLLLDRNKLVEDDRALLSDEGLSASDKCERSDKLNADIVVLDKEIEGLRDVDARRQREEDRRAKLANEPVTRQTERREPPKLPEKLAIKLGRHEQLLASDHQLAIRNTPEYLAAFDQYLAFGKVTEQLGLMVGKEAKGGYAAPMQMANQLIKFVDDNVFMRKISTVLPPLTDAESLGAISYDSDPGDADWTAEVPASAITEDDGMTFGKREMRPHLLTKLVLASDKFLRAAANSLPGGATNFIGDRLGYKFAITEEKAFLTGDGAQKPLGVFTASANGIPTTRDTTVASTTAFTADEIINALYALKTQYQDKATGLFSREFVRRARLLKDGTGQYLWGGGLMSGQSDRIANRPYIQSENVPSTYTTGQYVGIWGDFSWYWIVDSLSMSVQRLTELFALTNQIGFLGHKETDGMPVLAEAFSRIKLA